MGIIMNDVWTFQGGECSLAGEEPANSAILPVSHVNSHGGKNPLANNNPSPLSAKTTSRCTLTLIKPSILRAASAFPISLGSFETKDKLNTGKPKAESCVKICKLEEELMDIKEDSEEKTRTKCKLSIDPYQTEFTPELKYNFKRLLKFKGINKEEIVKRRANLDLQLKKKKTLILDIDGTLICCKTRKLYNDRSLIGEEIAEVRVRPFATQMLKMLSPFYELVIFTYGTASYANLIADYLDPQNSFIEYIFHRSHCIVAGNFAVKDLRVLGRRELRDMIILDNAVMSFAENMENGIYVPTYDGNADDRELEKVTEFLLKITSVEDVRPFVKEFAGIYRLFEVYKQTIN
eukprot:TRINITY_DN1413_c0_g1_i11.p1 TRINITY_DN1413_c0_g1~~TRINITY_DN1413_c0_g1_i11.p1  ORF type:complete len:349 (-),score=53.82 TRINITY_DN1413_c0_g1_i11:132-1178(-)